MTWSDSGRVPRSRSSSVQTPAVAVDPAALSVEGTSQAVWDDETKLAAEFHCLYTGFTVTFVDHHHHYCQQHCYLEHKYKLQSPVASLTLQITTITVIPRWSRTRANDNGFQWGMADSVQSIVECSRRPGLRSADTADYVKHRLQSKFGERCFSYAGPAAWNSLPHSIKLITDTSRFKQLLKSHLFRIAFCHFVSAPGQSVSRALQVRICICICICITSLILSISCLLACNNDLVNILFFFL